jgi:thioredoxin 1
LTGPIDLDASSWASEVEGSSVPLLVEFWHDGCVWCKRLEPFFNELAGEFAGKLKFAKLNILSDDRNLELAERFGVMGTPTLILFCRGRPLRSMVGYRPKEMLRREIQEMIDSYEDCFREHTPLAK